MKFIKKAFFDFSNVQNNVPDDLYIYCDFDYLISKTLYQSGGENWCNVKISLFLDKDYLSIFEFYEQTGYYEPPSASFRVAVSEQNLFKLMPRGVPSTGDYPFNRLNNNAFKIWYIKDKTFDIFLTWKCQIKTTGLVVGVKILFLNENDL